MTEEQLKFVKPILDTFENEDIKTFAIEILNNMPTYIWEVGASSTGKYHPSYTIGHYGLMKHQVAVVRFVNFFFELEQYKERYDPRKRDLIRLAALSHDGRKSGSQEDYEKSKYTKFEHPILIAKAILSYKDKGFLPEEELKFIAGIQTKHMGSWNTDKKSKLVLPTPNDEPSELLHLADYLASRKCLNISFDDYEIPVQEIDLDEYKMPFGKYKDKLLKDVPRDYIEWLSGQELKEPLNTAVKKILG
ncbi:DUF3820 family protein [Clostridium sp.]|uniref:putative quorum-sensing-regulated virulence factor n=1 Tax=Clostridium sp. TaxID=1506 RepID=UPI0032180113